MIYKLFVSSCFFLFYLTLFPEIDVLDGFLGHVKTKLTRMGSVSGMVNANLNKNEEMCSKMSLSGTKSGKIVFECSFRWVGNLQTWLTTPKVKSMPTSH